MDIHNSIMDIHNWIVDIYDLIMNIHNWIMDIHIHRVYALLAFHNLPLPYAGVCCPYSILRIINAVLTSHAIISRTSLLFATDFGPTLNLSPDYGWLRKRTSCRFN